MKGLQALFDNYYINVAFISWFVAQVLKTLLTLFVTKEFVPERLVGAGGMPSAHSALVCALTVAIERKVGFASAEFALALAFAAVVMYDAMGVRRAAGEQAKVLNKMIDSMSENIRDMFMTEKKKRLERFLNRNKDDEELKQIQLEKQANENEERKALLKEFLGHTPVEVLAGAILGVIVASALPIF